MSDHVLVKLLSTLTVRVHAFAFCEIQSGWRLRKQGIADALLVHYVLSGTGTIVVGDQEPVAFGPNSMVIPPRGVPHSLGFAGAMHTVTARDVRRQMIWDSLRSSGTEALVHLGVRG